MFFYAQYAFKNTSSDLFDPGYQKSALCFHIATSNRKAAIRRQPPCPFLFLLRSRKFSVTFPAKYCIHIFIAVNTLDIAEWTT